MGAMISFKDYLTEARMAPLYHGTLLVNLKEIVRGGLFPFTGHTTAPLQIRPSKRQDNMIIGVSMSRSFKFAKQRSTAQLVLELDQAQLAQKYRIVPLQYFYRKGARRYEETHPESFTVNEYEEFVITDKPIPFKFVSKIYVASRLANHPYINMLRQQYGSSFIVTFEPGG